MHVRSDSNCEDDTSVRGDSGTERLILLELQSDDAVITRDPFVRVIGQRRPGLYLVCCVLRAGVLNLHQHVRVQEIGGDHVRNERRGVFLEDCGHNVISYVPFPLELKGRNPFELVSTRDLCFRGRL